MNKSICTIRILKIVQDQSWAIDHLKETVDKWVEKLFIYYDPDNLDNLDNINETIEYIQKKDLIECKICQNPEKRYITQMYKKYSPVWKKESFQHLQDPEITFGMKMSSTPCVKCKSKNTTCTVMQARSVDEPPSFYYQCKAKGCGHCWKQNS